MFRAAPERFGSSKRLRRPSVVQVLGDLLPTTGLLRAIVAAGNKDNQREEQESADHRERANICLILERMQEGLTWNESSAKRDTRNLKRETFLIRPQSRRTSGIVAR